MILIKYKINIQKILKLHITLDLDKNIDADKVYLYVYRSTDVANFFVISSIVISAKIIHQIS